MYIWVSVWWKKNWKSRSSLRFRFGSSSDLTLNGHLHYPNDINRSLNEPVTDKIRKYRSDYNNNPSNATSFIPVLVCTSRRLHSEFVRLLFLQAHRETDLFFATSGVQLVYSTNGLLHFRPVVSSTQLKSKVGNTLVKATGLRVNVNIDGVSIPSRTLTHPSHSQTSRPLTSSLSLGVLVPRTTQCLRET